MPITLKNHEYLQARHSVRYQPGFIIWKDINLNYIAINNDTAKLLGHKNADDFIGINDYEVKVNIPDQLRESMRTHTRSIFHENEDRKWLQYVPTTNGVQLMYGTDTIIYNEQHQPMATIISTKEITTTSFLNMGVLLHKKLRDKILNREYFLFQLANKYKNEFLGRRQSQCLYHLLNGLRTKEIAQQMSVSPRTIETHLERIKFKLGCTTKSQLFEKANELGLFNFIISSG